MNRSISQVRLFVVTLILSLALVLGISSVVAAPSPCLDPGIHLFADHAVPDSAFGDQPCSDQGCTNDWLGCCSVMLSQSCCGPSGLAVLAATLAASVSFVRPSWGFMPANALAGTDPRLTRRPPRVFA